MNLSKRIEQLEAIANPPTTPVIRVYITGEDGLLRRTDSAGNLVETLTQAEYDNTPRDVVKLRVVYDHQPR